MGVHGEAGTWDTGRRDHREDRVGKEGGDRDRKVSCSSPEGSLDHVRCQCGGLGGPGGEVSEQTQVGRSHRQWSCMEVSLLELSEGQEEGTETSHGRRRQSE